MSTRKLAVAMIWIAASGTCYGDQLAGAQSVGKVLLCVNSGGSEVNPSSALVFTRAEDITSRMFTSAGVAVEWRSAGRGACRKPRQTRTIILDFATSTPVSQSPGALAYALPYEGVHIVVMLDRIQKKAADPAQVSALLAHVMTHEITHILQGIARHSETGLMKARWDAHDFLQMTKEPLPFTREDVALIELGLRQHAAGATSAGTSAAAATAELH